MCGETLHRWVRCTQISRGVDVSQREQTYTRKKKKKERNNNSFPFIAKRALDISNTENYSGYSRRDDGSHSMHPLACVCMCVCVYGLSVNSVASRLSLLAFLRHDRQSYMFIVKVKKKKNRQKKKRSFFVLLYGNNNQTKEKKKQYVYRWPLSSISSNVQLLFPFTYLLVFHLLALFAVRVLSLL